MERPTLRALEEARQTVDSAMTETRAELKRARRRAAADARVWVLSPRMRRTSLAIYMLAGYSTEPAVKYLEACGRERHWPVRTAAELSTVVEDLFLQADADEVAALADASSPSDPTLLAVALRYVEEWRVVSWAARLNSDRGVAPSTDSVVQRAEEGRMRLPEAARPMPVGPCGEPRAKRWVARLRARWGGRYASTPVGEHVEPEEARAKARPNPCPRHTKLGGT